MTQHEALLAVSDVYRADGAVFLSPFKQWSVNLSAFLSLGFSQRALSLLGVYQTFVPVFVSVPLHVIWAFGLLGVFPLFDSFFPLVWLVFLSLQLSHTILRLVTDFQPGIPDSSLFV